MPNGHALQPNPSDRLVLTTLGRAALECVTDSGERRELLASGKPLGLLVYLACSPGHSASREQLVDLLWADLTVEAARHSVRQAIWFLRQRLGEQAIAASDGTVQLSLAVESDRDAFLEAIERVEFERALEQYRGDFLPSFAAPGGADFEHWADMERFRLRRLFRHAGEAVVRDWLSNGRLRKAKDLAARLRDADPEDESAWRLVLETLLAATDRVGAELEAHRLEALLARAERPPEPATTGLLALARQAPPDSPTAATKPGLSAELIGREREFSSVVSAWEAARQGSGRHVHVTGGPGLGKTRLLTDVQARLRAAGVRVVAVRANPGERDVPYTLASDLVAQIAALPGAAAVSPASAGALVALNPSLSARYNAPVDRATEREALRRRETAFVELLVAVADEQPVALLIDDVHWGDPSSRQLVQGLAPKLSSRRILLVSCARPGPEGEIATAATERLALHPLTALDTGALLASLGQLPLEAWADGLPIALHAATHGSPLLMLETLHLLIERGSLSLANGAWACTDPTTLTSDLARGGALGRRIEEVERGQRWLLLLLATGGTPLDADLVTQAAGRDPDGVLADLQALEVRGLVNRDGGEWDPAHDEIAARTLELASPDARRAASAALGRLLAATGRDNPDLLHRAAHHLVASGDERQLERVFTRRYALQRRRGERRRPRALAMDLLGDAATPTRIRRLVRALPLHLRLGLTTPGRIAAAVLSGALTVAAVSFPLWRPAPPPPDAILVVVPPTAEDSITALAAPLRRADWERGRPIALRPYPALAAAGGRNDHAVSPDGQWWAFSRTVKDSGEIELFVVGPDGQPRRLTYAPGDDGAPSWSPDGRFLAFATNRWDIANRRSDIAILELGTGRVRRITHAGTGAALWSPDGSRIVFTAHPASLRTSLCWTSPDGRPGDCLAPFEAIWPVGWDDDQNVLVAIDSAGAHALARVNLDTKRVTVTVTEAGGNQASPDGRWITCYCIRLGFSYKRWWVYPTDAPDLARPLAADPGIAPRWVLPHRRSNHLDRLEIAPSSDTIPPGVPFHLRVRGFDVAGAPTAVHALVWRSEDASIAAVNATTGVVHPHREGMVRIVASAGGWREAERWFMVRARAASIVIDESWRDSTIVGWVRFGDPLPAVTAGPGGHPAFWNRGDGHFLSGVYSRSEFSLARGLAIDAQLSTPPLGPRQQFVVISLARFENRAALGRWDHRTGQPPELTEICGFQYPTGGGDRRSDGKFYVFAGQPWPAPHVMASGSWYDVRVQVFPDGRCGLAVNGRAVSYTSDPIPIDLRYQLLLWGNSLGTRMLVGPVKVWAGIPGGVDWSALEKRR